MSLGKRIKELIIDLAAADEGWRYVGAAGQPAFNTNWQNNGGVYADLSFYKDPTGRVHIRGEVENTAGTGVGETVFTLPAGYRPDEAGIYRHICTSFGDGYIIILTDGTVNFGGGDASAALNLDGLSFRAG